MPIPQLTWKRAMRSVRLLGKYGTPAKLKNMVQAEAAFRRHDVHLKSAPYLFRVDTGTHCTLSCPYCSRTFSEPQTPAVLSLDTFIQGFRPFAKYCLIASFQMFGEPLLNPSLPEMVRHAHDQGVATYVSTNLQNADEEQIENLLYSGLDLLTIALDAATPQTYEQMKPGGDFRKLRENIQTLFRIKQSVKRPPSVGFQVLVTRKNEGELDLIRQYADEMKVDYLDLKTMLHLEDSSWIPTNPHYRLDRFKNKKPDCALPWFNITLLANGQYFPCCAYPGNFDLGSIGENPMENIWNGQKMKALRKGFATGELAAMCNGCMIGRMPRF